MGSLHEQTNSQTNNQTSQQKSWGPGQIEVIEVKNSKNYRDFLNLPDQIYTDVNTRYVKPLNLHMKMMIGKLGQGQKHLFLARKNGATVARIAAKVHKYGNHTTLNFGFYECLEGHQDATLALINAVHALYPNLKVIGPHHFRMEDPYIGVLTEGFDQDPFFLMSYNPPYYKDYLEKAGFTKVMDLFTYELHSKNPLEPSLYKNAEESTKAGVTIRTVNRKKLYDESRIISGIFNDALSKNWGFEEFLEDQINEMVMMMKMFLDTDVVSIAMLNGKPVGCLIMLPNYNPLIKPFKGKVTPGFILKFMNRKKYVNNLRGYALGVLKEAHGLGIGSLLVKDMFERGPRHGYPSAEVSWVLANNGPMNELSKAMGGKHSKVYRIFEKAPLSSPKH